MCVKMCYTTQTTRGYLPDFEFSDLSRANHYHMQIIIKNLPSELAMRGFFGPKFGNQVAVKRL